MLSLEQAVQDADNRKQSATGLVEPDNAQLIMPSEQADRLMFSGWDIDYAELSEFAQRAGMVYCGLVAALPLTAIFTSAWTEGLLVGLMLARQAQQEGDME